jgi:tetratricopeptide (TPR) repeat protein
MWVAPHLTLIDVDGLTDKVVADAPSVRAVRFGGIGIGDEGARHRNAVLERAAAYALDVHRPEYVLAFEMHNGLGPDAPGFVYPELVAHVLGRAQKDAYSEIWRGVKTDGDVWNHLLARPDAATEVPAETRRARLLHAIELCPRVSGFVRALYCEFPSDEESRTLVRERAPRFASDVWFVRDVLYFARQEEDHETARAVYDAARRGALGTEPWLYRMMAEVPLDSGDWHAAETVFIEGIKAVPESDTTLLYDLAWLREKRLADPEGAVAALEQIMERDPADEQARRERERLTAPEPTSRSEPTS